jgi:hypothetical protein
VGVGAARYVLIAALLTAPAAPLLACGSLATPPLPEAEADALPPLDGSPSNTDATAIPQDSGAPALDAPRDALDATTKPDSASHPQDASNEASDATTQHDGSAPADADASAPRDSSLTDARDGAQDVVTSPSSLTFQLTAPQPDLWIVSQGTDLPYWLTILDASGRGLPTDFLAVGCPSEPQAPSCVDCMGCIDLGPAWCACPIGFFITPLGAAGAVQGWDGIAYTASSCGVPSMACTTLATVPAGDYAAQMCACPGASPGNPYGWCTVCVTVPFHYPSSATVVGTLPTLTLETLGGTVTGLLPGNTVVIDDGPAGSLTLMANGPFQFSQPVPSGQTYLVEVDTNPASQLCTITSAAGTVGTGPVTSVQVDCVTESLDATAVATSFFHTCAVLAGGTMACWGEGGYGQLGNGAYPQEALVPVPVVNLTGATAAGEGYAHTCALLSGGTVQCWGDNQYGQLGNGVATGTNGPGANAPVMVSGLSGVTTIALGESHSCASLSDGTVKCWGDNAWGELGNGGTTNASSPVLVPGLTGVTAVSASGVVTCALLANGGVDCWGSAVPSMGSRPTPVPGLATATTLSVGGGQSCSVLSGGSVACWPNQSADAGAPTPIAGLGTATAVSTGGGFACALLLDGTVACWGDNGFGELGNGTSTSSAVPVVIPGLRGVTAVSAGGSYACAVVSDGGVDCWGDDGQGQLGNGNPGGSTTTPAPVP